MISLPSGTRIWLVAGATDTGPARLLLENFFQVTFRLVSAEVKSFAAYSASFMMPVPVLAFGHHSAILKYLLVAVN